MRARAYVFSPIICANEAVWFNILFVSFLLLPQPGEAIAEVNDEAVDGLSQKVAALHA